MDGKASRRSILHSTVGLTCIAATGTTTATSGRDGAGTALDRRSPASDSPGEPKGFVRSWTATHVQSGETRVREVVPSLGEGAAFVVGETSSDGSYENRRVWVGEFDADGVRWSKTLRADGHSETPRIVEFDDHYLVFWAGIVNGTDAKLVTRIDPDGNVRFQREVDSPLFAFRDVVGTENGYLGGRAGEVSEVRSDFSVESTFDLPTPEGHDGGAGTESLVPVSDGYVATGTVAGDATEQAFWAVKFDGTDGTIYWSKAYEFDDYVFGGTAARVGDDRVAIVGSYGEANDPIAMVVDGDGTKRWQSVPSVDGIASFEAVQSDGDRIRALGTFDDDVGVVTFDRSGSIVDRWRDETGDRDLIPRSFRSVGDGRYVVGGDVDDADVDAKAFVMRLQPNQPPTPAVSMTPKNPNATEPVTFDASGTTDPDTSVAALEWNLDDDAYAEQTGETMTTTFESAGTHEVTLRAVDVYGAVGKQVVSVSVGANTAPSASLSVSDEEPRVGDEVQVRATSVSDAETAVETITWTVDGESVDANGPEFSVTFDGAGEYTVAATLTDTAGVSNTVETTVTVLAPTTTATTQTTRSTTAKPTTAGTGTGGEASSPTTGADGDDDTSPVPGFGVGGAALAVSAVAALARRLGTSDDVR